jgi:hypothetical protein
MAFSHGAIDMYPQCRCHQLDAVALPPHICCVCCCLLSYKQLLHNRAGAEEYDAAALLLDHAANLLLPKLQYLSGPNICSCLAAFAR